MTLLVPFGEPPTAAKANVNGLCCTHLLVGRLTAFKACKNSEKGQAMATQSFDSASATTANRSEARQVDWLEAIWAPRVLSIVRIVTGLIFMEHGTQKLLNFPPLGRPAPEFLDVRLRGPA